MPRKTATSRSTERERSICFNEAAARCRGKRGLVPIRGGSDAASMRPRPDAAENVVSFAVSGIRPLASMRPRPDAAENFEDKSLVTAEEVLQ